MRSNVAILGFTQHGYKAPWGNPEWDFKGLNDLHSVWEQQWPKCFAEHADQIEWYQLHRKQPDGQYPGARDEGHTEWLAKQTCPIWMWAHDETIPASQPYPLADILTKALLPTGESLSPEQYWNNSISWMIAHAILQGYKTIGLYGVDMAMDGVHGESEYQHQRPSVEYLIGVARGLGIRVVMPQESELLKCAFLYGWDNEMHVRSKLLQRHQGLVADEQGAVDAYETTKRSKFMITGALQLLMGQTQAPQLNAIRAHIPEAVLKDAVAALEADDTTASNQFETAKCQLHEVRGAKNNTQWLLKNYFPGEGPIQDVPRTEASLTMTPLTDSPTAPPPSDGKNRILDLVKD